MPYQVGHLFQETCKGLLPVSRDLAQREAELIFKEVLSISRSTLYTSFKATLSANHQKNILNFTKERLSGKPLAYILGASGFYSKTFFVSKDVLIPRPDTEIVIEEIVKNEPAGPCLFLDIGTGSGNIAESLCGIRPQWNAIATDVSMPSLQVAKKNCSPRIILVCCDKLFAFKKHFTVDFIVSNPPYISKKEMKNLDPSVKDHEPALALYGGEDGLDFYRYLALHSRGLLKSCGWIYCEIGFTQGMACTAIFENAGWNNISIANDLASRPRVIRAQK